MLFIYFIYLCVLFAEFGGYQETITIKYQTGHWRSNGIHDYRARGTLDKQWVSKQFCEYWIIGVSFVKLSILHEVQKHFRPTS